MPLGDRAEPPYRGAAEKVVGFGQVAGPGFAGGAATVGAALHCSGRIEGPPEALRDLGERYELVVAVGHGVNGRGLRLAGQRRPGR